MAEHLVRELTIEEAFQIEIQATIAHNNKSSVKWCALSYEERNKNKVNSPLHMIWAGRRYHLEGDMNPIADIPSSSVVYPRGLLVWSSIQSLAKIVLLQIRG